MPIGLYLHIPFCAAICNYCNFNRGLHDDGLRRRYVDALVADIRRHAAPRVAADTIFFGGGTPSLLEPGEVAAILTACRESFALATDAEVTLEANPESSTAEMLDGVRAAGVNRLSFGVQSFHDAELKRLGRLHTAATARAAVALARAAGFDNLSLDLMMWLPGQRPADWLASVDALIDVGPDHASLYLLEIYPNAPLKDEMARGGWSVAPDDDAAEMYEDGLGRLDRAGYEQYEISNVARPATRRARHNLKYWQEGEWIGFGCGAHSTYGGERWRTLNSTAEYVQRMAAGASVQLDRRQLAPQERLEEALFMGLRLVDGLDLPLMRERHGVDIWTRYGQDLAPFVQAGLLVHEPDRRLALTRAGMLLANEVMSVFIGHPGTVE
ncbi:MAG: radical SAM family heme chaperone HemW [Acidobacteria bacterium]|nr:radical SAM family heme chaperone HemW [Acidobacteriota bacterium]MSO61278.1 radical SAM family heme chaperone HemW [Acidobacteriota bacterium]